MFRINRSREVLLRPGSLAFFTVCLASLMEGGFVSRVTLVVAERTRLANVFLLDTRFCWEALVAAVLRSWHCYPS